MSASASTALLFPGQASQYVGMGVELRALSPQAASCLEAAERATALPLSELCAAGPIEDLTRTEAAQPAVVVTSVMAWLALKERLTEVVVERPIGLCAGHSVGEYAALVAAGALEPAEALRLVDRRARLMAEACAAVDGTMAAVIGLHADAVRVACAEASRATGSSAETANLNALDQVVISGERRAVEEASRLAREAGARRVLPLNVAGPFHSRYMRGAGEAFATVVTRAAFQSPAFPIVLNQTAEPTTDVDEIRRELVEQIWSPVRWVESLERMWEQGCTRFIELGPGTVLSGLVRRTLHRATVLNVQDAASLEHALKALGPLLGGAVASER